MQKDSKILDDLARMMSGAVGGVAEAKREIDSMIHRQVDKMLTHRQLVTREEFDAVSAMAAKARAEQEKLEKRLESLEKKLQD
jgi:BMFP domain-containing protein YqiC